MCSRPQKGSLMDLNERTIQDGGAHRNQEVPTKSASNATFIRKYSTINNGNMCHDSFIWLDVNIVSKFIKEKMHQIKHQCA